MFFRSLLYIIVTVLAITFIRSVIGLIMKTMGELLHPSSASPGKPGPGPMQGGELKKDPVCGTYVSAATSVKKNVKGEVVHFCSEACRAKHQA